VADAQAAQQEEARQALLAETARKEQQRITRSEFLQTVLLRRDPDTGGNDNG
jgi:hypothetical protein